MDLVNHLEGRLLFAVPKKGRLNQPTLNLLEGADIQFKREHRLDIAIVKNLPIALVFLPAADIPTFVSKGRVDLGITGWDQVREYGTGVQEETGGCEVLLKLGFGTCKLQVQVPQQGAYATAQDLVGKTVCTSFPNLAREHFAKLEGSAPDFDTKLRTKIIELSGSVEAACALGVADGIVDLVESGETMKAAGLIAVDDVVASQAVLIASKSPSPSNLGVAQLITSRLRGVIAAHEYVLCQYNVERTQLEAATKITPGRRAPTITGLESEGWVAVSAMVESKRIAVVMDELSRVGAQDILVLKIHNAR